MFLLFRYLEKIKAEGVSSVEPRNVELGFVAAAFASLLGSAGKRDVGLLGDRLNARHKTTQTHTHTHRRVSFRPQTLPQRAAAGASAKRCEVSPPLLSPPPPSPAA